MEAVAERPADGSRGFQTTAGGPSDFRRGATVEICTARHSSVAPRRMTGKPVVPWDESHGYHPFSRREKTPGNLDAPAVGTAVEFVRQRIMSGVALMRWPRQATNSNIDLNVRWRERYEKVKHSRLAD